MQLNKFDLDLNNSDDYIIDLIYESIGDENNLNIIYECASESIMQFTNYGPIIEAVNEYNNIKKEIKNDKKYIKNNKNNPKKQLDLIDKLKKICKDAFDWWYKEEPNKKFKKLRIILRICLEITFLIFMVYNPGAEIIANHAMLGSLGKISRKIAYKGLNIHLLKLFNAESILLMTIRIIYSALVSFIFKFDNDIYDDVNLKDIDLNIKEFDNAIDKLNDQIMKLDKDDKRRNILIKSKKDLEDVLCQLEKIRNRHNKK